MLHQITGVPDGEYLLRISINPDQVIEESDYGNDTVEVPVTLAPPAPVDPLSERTQPLGGALRECGWAFAPGLQGVSCTPGELLTVGRGCNPAGSCGGDPMLRVCAGSEACGAQAALASVDDACGLCPQLDFACPDSGVHSVLSASFDPNAPFVCDVKPPL